MERTIGAGARVDDWVIGKDAHLTSNGAELKQSRISSGKLTLNAGTKAQDIYATQGSQVSLDGTTLEARASTAYAVNLQGSHAQIRGSSVINNNGVGILAARNFLTQDGSTVNVFDSLVQGSTEGARATSFSQLNFIGSDVVATDENGIGVLLFGGSASASDSRIIGGENGVRLSYEYVDMNASTLVLSGSHVEGRNGAALLVEGMNTARLTLTYKCSTGRP